MRKSELRESELRESGVRKSGITLAALSAWQICQAFGWYSVMWAPRCSGCRGVASRKSCSTSHESTSSIAYEVSAAPLAAIASMPASAVIDAASSTAYPPSTGGVPTVNRSIVSTGSYPAAIANWSR